MQSGQKKQGRGGRKRNNPRNSFVPQDNSANNQFLSHNSRVSQQPSSLMSPPNSKNNEQSPRIKRPSRQNQIQSSRKGKNSSNRGRNHKKMQVIHEQNLNIKMSAPLNPKMKKNTYQSNEPQLQERRASPRKDVHSYIIQQTQSQMVEDQPVAQQKKMKELNAGMQKLSQSILQLKSNYKQLQQEQVKHHVKIDHKSREHLPDKSKQKIKQSALFGQKTPEEYERQYKQYLKKKNEQKMARKKVLQQLAEKDRIKLEQYKRQRQQKKQAQRRQRIKEIRQRQRYKFQDKHKRYKQIEAQRKKAIQQFVKKYEGVEYVAFKKQKQDQQRKKQLLQQQKQFLLQRKEMFKPIDFEQIDQHEKWYLDKIQQLTNQRRELKNQSWKKIQQQNAELPQFWKGKAHNIALQERLQKVRKRKQPKQKVKRMNEYRAYIRQHFVPRTHENKSQHSPNLRNESSLTHRQIKRYRYYKGVSYGQVLQTRPIAKSYQQIRRMGIHNFELMKKMPKKRSNSSKMEAYELKLLQQSRSRVKKQEHFLPEQDKKLKNVKIQLPDSVKSDELTMVMKRLKAHDEKLKHKQYALNSQPQVLNEYIDQKAINDEIIENIQRKLSLLSQL